MPELSGFRKPNCAIVSEMMRMRMNTLQHCAATLALALAATLPSAAADFQYFRLGNPTDLATRPSPGIAMMGGGSDLDEAFRWLCQKANGGDFLILRARGDDDYNAWVNGLCRLNSVATLILPNRQAAQDPAVDKIIRQAEVIFIAGGDQSNYIRGWKGTLVDAAINADIAAAKPIGGTSAGLAVLGEFAYGALGDKPDDDDLASPQVLSNPFLDRVTVVRGFLQNPQLAGILTDSHFARRDRMGRSLGFLARIMQDGWSPSPREIAIDEKSAVLVEADGKATVVGQGKGAYLLQPTEPPAVCQSNQPLTFRKIHVYRLPTGGHFDLRSWSVKSGSVEKGSAEVADYFLSVEAGKIESTQPGGAIY